MSVSQFTTAPAPANIPLSSHDLRQIALYDMIHAAIANEQPLVVLYATKGVEDKARVIVPQRLFNTDAGADLVRAHDSLSNDIRSFRMDRIKACHHLMMV